MLAGPGRRFTGIARHWAGDAAEWDDLRALDARDTAAVGEFVDGAGGFAAVVAYEPAVTQASWRRLTSAADRAVIVLPSRYASADVDPGDELAWRGDEHVSRLVLGWAGRGPHTRWHTPEEISGAVARLMDEFAPGSRQVLGVLQPWSSRPG